MGFTRPAHSVVIMTVGAIAVFSGLTDNWLELTVRFIVPDHGVRDVKDAVARAVL